MTGAPHGRAHAAGAPGHDPEGTRAVAVGKVLAAILALVVAAGVLVGIFFPDARRPLAPGRPVSPATRDVLATGSAHWAAPAADLAAARREWARRRDGWGWADRDSGRARIPLARALELLAAGGRVVPADTTAATAAGAP